MADTYAGIHDLTEVTSLGANDEFEVATASGNTYTGKRIKASNMGLLPGVSSGDAGKVLAVDDNGDWAPTTPSGGGMHNYSTTEHKVGTWVDGSDIYEITLNLNQTLSTGETTLYHGISNLDKCISIVACCTYNNGSEWLYLPYLSPAYVSSYSVAMGNVNSSTYKINVGSLFTSIENVYVTIQYTKTAS